MFGSKKQDTKSVDTSIEAIAAAMWWADQLRNGAKLDNGDDSPNGGIFVALALLGRPSISEEQVQQFQEELAKRVDAQLQQSSYGVTLDCDYHPDHMLAESADAAGIRSNIGVLPVKTTMHVRKGEVTVSCGYGASYVTVPIG